MKLSEITMPTMIRQFIADFSVLVQEPAHHDRLIILLHGWGADASDLMDLAPALFARFENASSPPLTPRIRVVPILWAKNGLI